MNKNLIYIPAGTCLHEIKDKMEDMPLFGIFLTERPYIGVLLYKQARPSDYYYIYIFGAGQYLISECNIKYLNNTGAKNVSQFNKTNKHQ